MSRTPRREPGAEYRALWKALGGAKSYEHGTIFFVPCMICGRKTKKNIMVREEEDGHVSCECRGCGATKEEICARIGFDPTPYRVEAIAEREMEKTMAAMDVIGANRCTACEHYVCEKNFGTMLYGCTVKNLYRKGEIWEDAGGGEPCRLYRANRETLHKGLVALDDAIAAYERVTKEFKERRERLQALLEET